VTTPANAYLILGILAGATSFTALLRVPPVGWLGILWWATSFAAFHFAGSLMLAGIALTLLGALLGVFRSTAGIAGAGLGLASLIALQIVRQRSFAIGAPLEQALEKTLGMDYRQCIPANRVRAPAQADAAESRNPLRLRLPGVVRLADLSYGDGGKRNSLDLYRPADSSDPAPMPILLWVHGGAWVTGHKTQQGLPLIYGMARRRWLVASINYRLAPADRFPKPLVDVKKAIAWLRMNAAEYGGDPNFIVAAGGSAGAHLAFLAALTPNHAKYQAGFESTDTRLAGAISLYGRFDLIDRNNVLPDKRLLLKFLGDHVMPCHYEENPVIWDEASPIALVGPQAPPLFVLHGTHDSLIPIAEARAFIESADRVSPQPCVFAELAGAQHAWDLFNTPWTHCTVSALHRFAEYLYAKHIKTRH
jgi:acetyl esterase/lipase